MMLAITDIIQMSARALQWWQQNDALVVEIFCDRCQNLRIWFVRIVEARRINEGHRFFINLDVDLLDLGRTGLEVMTSSYMFASSKAYELDGDWSKVELCRTNILAGHTHTLLLPDPVAPMTLCDVPMLSVRLPPRERYLRNEQLPLMRWSLQCRWFSNGPPLEHFG